MPRERPLGSRAGTFSSEQTPNSDDRFFTTNTQVRILHKVGLSLCLSPSEKKRERENGNVLKNLECRGNVYIQRDKQQKNVESK
jgi:hypothetical protein